MSSYFGKVFSKYHCGFKQGLSSQYCLISMTEKWKKSVESSKTFTVLLTGLSKAFDWLPHELLIAKRNAKLNYFSLPSSRLMHSYLSNRKQITKICS